MIIDVAFEDDRPFPPAVMLQALKQLVFAMESNLMGGDTYDMLISGSDVKGCSQRLLHFHTDQPGLAKAILKALPAGPVRVVPFRSSGDQGE